MRYPDEPTPDERCGTNAGWNAHQRRNERQCAPCQAAHTAYQRDYRYRRGLVVRTLRPVEQPGRCVAGLGWPA